MPTDEPGRSRRRRRRRRYGTGLLSVAREPVSAEGRVDMSAARQWPGVAPLVGFLALAFGLSWGVGAVFKGVPIVSPDGLFIGGVSLAAIIVVAFTEGRAGLRDLGHRLVRWRVGALGRGPDRRADPRDRGGRGSPSAVRGRGPGLGAPAALGVHGGVAGVLAVPSVGRPDRGGDRLARVRAPTAAAPLVGAHGERGSRCHLGGMASAGRAG